MKRVKGNVILNVILITSLCTVFLNGIFLIAMHSSEINSLKRKEQREINSEVDKRKEAVNSAIIECFDSSNKIDENKLKSLKRRYDDFEIYYEDTKGIVVKKKLSGSVFEYHYFKCEKNDKNIIFLKESKYYEIK
ncbi:hypothetical protein SAMN02745163_02236 [Clostridium cavendishii DSM 21758]|uniref:Uncharacterized protein n=1 Tax=Clostridium cavendishii DSM 21758 TaxID=1121302 RepID=A0A1M6KM31_9CLOT|nr:hypothetical protein [Clostridium cavendishii]SHJ60001.1 hypothetical protein SAMN02745163_02236 [Clostridium cavendishii DSM 21758]